MAMMLVLISLATATILTMAYMSSRDNSIEIGTNVADSATARWSAMSGLELGVSVLETETDWRTNHTNGMLLDDYTIGDATVDLTVEDIETSAPPTESTTLVRLTSTAMVGGIAQTASATAQVSGSSGSGIDVDLSEFAIFVGQSAHVSSNGTIARWPTAPSSEMGKRIAIGTNTNGAGAIQFNDDAAAIDATVYHGPGASGSLVLNTRSPSLQIDGLLDDIPMPAAPSIPVANPGVTGNDMDVQKNVAFNADITADDFKVTTPSGLVTLQGDITLIAVDLFELSNNAGIVIDGNVTIISFGKLSVGNDSFIELMPGATLMMYLDDQLIVSNGYIGDLRADRSARDVSGASSYVNPERIQIFGSTNNVNWGLRNQSVIKASLYGPANTLNIREDSAVYGRVAARKLTVQDQGAIFYDHALDNGNGYTNPDSPIFEADSTIKADITALASLDDASLQALADSLGTSIKGLFGLLDPAGGSDDTPIVVGPGDPTPRTVTVAIRFEQHGTDRHTWENRAAGAVVVTVDDSGGSGQLQATLKPMGDITVVH